jgi:hypothetical protein
MNWTWDLSAHGTKEELIYALNRDETMPANVKAATIQMMHEFSTTEILDISTTGSLMNGTGDLEIHIDPYVAPPPEVMKAHDAVLKK